MSNLENGAAKQCGQMLHSGKIADKSHHKQTLFYGGIPNPRPDKGKQAFETASGIFNGRRKNIGTHHKTIGVRCAESATIFEW